MMNFNKKDVHSPAEKIELAVMMDHLMALSDEEWAYYLFANEPLNGKVDEQQKIDLIHKAIETGKEYSSSYKRQYGNISALKLAEKLDVKVSFPEMPSGGGHVIFGQYTEPNEIVIFKDCLDKFEQLKDSENLVFDRVLITNMLVLHEIYHHLEYLHQDEIFTRKFKLKLWNIGRLKNESPLYCLGEIAAMQFAKEFLELDYSPSILDVLLVCAYDHASGQAIYENIMRIVKDVKIDEQRNTND